MTVRHERQSAPDTRRAWLSLLGFAPSLVLAFVVGEAVISAIGYPTGGDTEAPWWAMLTAGVPALAVFAIPAGTAVFFGRRALRAGDDRARTPIIVAVVLAASFVALNGISALTIWLG